jgi:flagellar motor switch protein FliN/FliY
MSETAQQQDSPDSVEKSRESANDNSINAGNNLGLVLEIPVTLSMEIGRTRMRIADLLELSSGSVVDLQKMVDEPLDVLVNGTLVAHGEAVVMDGKFGIRLTDVVSKQERLKNIS